MSQNIRLSCKQWLSLIFCSEDFSLFLKCISLSKKQSLEGHPTFHLSGIHYLTVCCWWMKLKDTAESRGPNSSSGSTLFLRSTKRKENPLLPTSPHPPPAPIGADFILTLLSRSTPGSWHILSDPGGQEESQLEVLLENSMSRSRSEQIK